MQRVIVLTFLALILFLEAYKFDLRREIRKAVMFDDISELTNTSYLDAVYTRSVLAWNFACNQKNLSNDFRQDLMIRAYLEMSDLNKKYPKYLEVGKFYSEMEKARYVRPK